MCNKPDCLGGNSNLKQRHQQYAAVNTLEAIAEYEAAMNTHNAAVNIRAVKKNKELREQKKKRYR